MSDTELTATIPASDIVSAGTASVTVWTDAPGGGLSGSQTFTISVKPTSYSWTPTAAGAYNWNDASSQDNWATEPGGPFPNEISDTASMNIDVAGAQVVSLNQAITVGTLNLGDTAGTYYATTIQNGVAGSLTFEVAAGSAQINKTTAGNNVTDIISATVTLNDPIAILNEATSGSLLFSGSVGGTGTSTKDGAGTGAERANERRVSNPKRCACTITVRNRGKCPSSCSYKPIKGSWHNEGRIRREVWTANGRASRDPRLCWWGLRRPPATVSGQRQQVQSGANQSRFPSLTLRATRSASGGTLAAEQELHAARVLPARSVSTGPSLGIADAQGMPRRHFVVGFRACGTDEIVDAIWVIGPEYFEC